MKLSTAIGKWKAKGIKKEQALEKAKAAVKKLGERWSKGKQEIFDESWSKTKVLKKPSRVLKVNMPTTEEVVNVLNRDRKIGMAFMQIKFPGIMLKATPAQLLESAEDFPDWEAFKDLYIEDPEKAMKTKKFKPAKGAPPYPPMGSKKVTVVPGAAGYKFTNQKLKSAVADSSPEVKALFNVLMAKREQMNALVEKETNNGWHFRVFAGSRGVYLLGLNEMLHKLGYKSLAVKGGTGSNIYRNKVALLHTELPGKNTVVFTLIKPAVETKKKSDRAPSLPGDGRLGVGDRIETMQGGGATITAIKGKIALVQYDSGDVDTIPLKELKGT